MPATILCPNPGCGASYTVVDEHLGRIGRCKKCGAKFPLVPRTVVGTGAAPMADSTTEPESSPDRDASTLPESFGRYKILRLLGRGGMGAVYLAVDSQLKRQVALKVPHVNAFADRPEVRVRFVREAEAAARFHHPNFCPIFDIGEVDGVPFLTMAFIEGETLSASIGRDTGWEARRAAEVSRQLALALAELHRQGIIHRDLKPANIMVDGRGGLVIMDFGLARWYDDLDSTFTPTGAILGTPAYMPPEQAEGNLKAVGPRSDVYSLGVILYELLTGHRPFEGPITKVLGMIAYVEPSPPSTLRPGIDPALEAICLKAMAKKPDARHASMDDLAGALRAWLDEDRAPLPRINLQEPDRPSPKSIRSPESAVGPGPRPPAPSYWVLAVALTAIASVAVAAWTLSARPNPAGVVSAPADREKPAGKARVVAESDDRREPDPIPPAVPSKPDPALSPKPDPAPSPKPEVDPMTNSIGMKFRPIPTGDFLMGSVDGDGDEKPRHKVRITRPFELGTTEVTVGQFRRFVDDNHYRTDAERSVDGGSGWDDEKRAIVQSPRFHWRWPGFDQADEHPVVDVSWNDAVKFCRWLELKERVKYRLPTEAEWEYACRAGTTSRYSSGDDSNSLVEVGNVSDAAALAKIPSAATLDASDGYVFTAPVGRFRPNAWGLYDMHGNVWEWCSDWYDEGYYKRLAPTVSDPGGPPTGPPHRVMRGGSWSSKRAEPTREYRSSFRNYEKPDFPSIRVGFRVVRVR